VTVAVPLLLCIIGLALIVGRKSPPWITAGVFLIIGFYTGQTEVGREIVSGINYMTRLIG
jgi:hypothetical protein